MKTVVDISVVLLALNIVGAEKCKKLTESSDCSTAGCYWDAKATKCFPRLQDDCFALNIFEPTDAERKCDNKKWCLWNKTIGRCSLDCPSLSKTKCKHAQIEGVCIYDKTDATCKPMTTLTGTGTSGYTLKYYLAFKADYGTFAQNLTWCKSIGGRLPNMCRKDDYDRLVSVMNKLARDDNPMTNRLATFDYYVGAVRDRSRDDVIRWTTGDTAWDACDGRDAWGPGEPNGSGDCGRWMYDSAWSAGDRRGRLDDNRCTDYLYGMCVIGPEPLVFDMYNFAAIVVTPLFYWA